jgi:hypothetical protein
MRSILGETVSKTSLVLVLVVLSACQLFQESVPIKCTRRESFIGNGYVVKVENQSNNTLSLWIETSENKKYFTLEPHGSTEFGWLEGFHFGDNSSFSIGGEGYLPLSFTKMKITEQK